jgi:hypothetical protein
MLPIISYSDLNCPTVPGNYSFNGAFIRVDNQHLQAWRECPELLFHTILLTRVGENSRRLTLGVSASR